MPSQLAFTSVLRQACKPYPGEQVLELLATLAWGSENDVSEHHRC